MRILIYVIGSWFFVWKIKKVSKRLDETKDRKDYKAAIKELTEAISINPKYAEAYNKRCHAYLMQGNRLRAMEDCTQALQIKTNFAQAYQAYTNRGIARLALGDSTGAIADYTQAIAIKADYGEAFFNRGVSYFKLGNRQLATKDFERAVALFQQQGNTTAVTNARNALAAARGNQPRRR